MKKATKGGMALALSVVVAAFAAGIPAKVSAQAMNFALGDIFNIKQEFAPELIATEQVESSEPQVMSTSTEEPAEPEAEAPEPIIVVVQKGDSLSKIAKAHNTQWKRLFDANPSISDPNLINPGDQIRIPFADEIIAERALPTPAPVAAPKPKAARAASQPVATNAPAVADGSVWDRLAACESGGRWNINTGNGYYGGLQFLPSTWRGVGGTGLPHQHSREEQIYRAEILLARSGWGQWPQCARKLGLL